MDKNDAKLDIISAENISEEIETRNEIEIGLLHILRTWGGTVEKVQLGNKWDGGKLILQPLDTNLKPKELPIDDFFHKIVMLRDRLRVLEQNINSHKILNNEEKVNLQQYITRCYGTLTTFNVLFKNKEHWFIGERKK